MAEPFLQPRSLLDDIRENMTVGLPRQAVNAKGEPIIIYDATWQAPEICLGCGDYCPGNGWETLRLLEEPKDGNPTYVNVRCQRRDCRKCSKDRAIKSKQLLLDQGTKPGTAKKKTKPRAAKNRNAEIDKKRRVHCTVEFEKAVFRLAMLVPFRKVAKHFHVSLATVRRIVLRVAKQLVSHYPVALKSPIVGIDDAHEKPKHYKRRKRTNMQILDLGTKGYPTIALARSMKVKDVLETILHIPGFEGITTVVGDQSKTNLSLVRQLSEILGRDIMFVLDHYHVVDKFTEGMSAALKILCKRKDFDEAPLVSSNRHLLLKRRDRLSGPERKIVKALLNLNKDLKRLYIAYHTIYVMYGCTNPQDADAKFSVLERRVKACPPELQKPLAKAVGYVNNTRKEVMNYFRVKLTNGPTEKNNDFFKKIMAFSKGCPFYVKVTRSLYDRGAWKDDYAIERIVCRLPPPAVQPFVPAGPKPMQESLKFESASAQPDTGISGAGGRGTRRLPPPAAKSFVPAGAEPTQESLVFESESAQPDTRISGVEGCDTEQ